MPDKYFFSFLIKVGFRSESGLKVPGPHQSPLYIRHSVVSFVNNSEIAAYTS